MTLPITTTKQLVKIARLLRTKYYFHKIPDDWIEIKENSENITINESNLQPLPDKLEELKQIVAELPNIDINAIPITTQANVTPTLNSLKQHFIITNIPQYLLELALLPEPEWDIFD